jgi:aspartate/methionine/tyrosine aminotransferase
VLLASPSNPTGTSIERAEMRRIVDAVRERGGFTLVDEIYLGLSYDDAFGHSALEHGVGHGDDVVSINSFSKYFGMTGWRLGWLVLPRVAGGAGGEAGAEPLHLRLQRWRSTRRWPASSPSRWPSTSAAVPSSGRGATSWCRPWSGSACRCRWCPMVRSTPTRTVSAHAASSWDLCFDLMRRAQVALTPGRDFGRDAGERHLRLSFARSMGELREAMGRLEATLRP